MVSNAKVTTSIKIDKTKRDEAKKIFNQLGLTMGEAFNIFLSRVIMEKGIPFEVKIPNETTLKALEEAKSNQNMEESSLDKLIKA